MEVKVINTRTESFEKYVSQWLNDVGPIEILSSAQSTYKEETTITIFYLPLPTEEEAAKRSEEGFAQYSEILSQAAKRKRSHYSGL